MSVNIRYLKPSETILIDIREFDKVNSEELTK